MPVTLDSNGVDKLVSVADSNATKPLPLKRFRMEAEVGIERDQGVFQNPLLRNYHPTTRG